MNRRALVALVTVLVVLAIGAVGLFLFTPARGAVAGPDCADALGVGEITGPTQQRSVAVGAVLSGQSWSVGVLKVGTLDGRDAAQVSIDATPGKCAMVVGTTYAVDGVLVRLDAITAATPLEGMTRNRHGSIEVTVQGD